VGNPSWVVDDDEQLLDVQLSRRPPSYGLGATDHRKNSASPVRSNAAKLPKWKSGATFAAKPTRAAVCWAGLMVLAGLLRPRQEVRTPPLSTLGALPESSLKRPVISHQIEKKLHSPAIDDHRGCVVSQSELPIER